MENKYTTLKKELAEELNAFPLFFAFNEKQFQEGRIRLNTTMVDIARLPAGGFIRKVDIPRLHDLFDRQQARRAEFLATRDNMTAAILYELANHEYSYTHDAQPALDALGLSFDNARVRECLGEALRQLRAEEREQEQNND